MEQKVHIIRHTIKGQKIVWEETERERRTRIYKESEIKRFNNEIKAIEIAPRRDRQEARIELMNILGNNIEHFLRSCEFLVSGDYGAGSYYSYKQLSKRNNRKAWIFVTVSQIEYQCSSAYARKCWNILTPEIQTIINNKLDSLINEENEE